MLFVLLKSLFARPDSQWSQAILSKKLQEQSDAQLVYHFVWIVLQQALGVLSFQIVLLHASGLDSTCRDAAFPLNHLDTIFTLHHCHQTQLFSIPATHRRVSSFALRLLSQLLVHPLVHLEKELRPVSCTSPCCIAWLVGNKHSASVEDGSDNAGDPDAREYQGRRNGGWECHLAIRCGHRSPEQSSPASN